MPDPTNHSLRDQPRSRYPPGVTQAPLEMLGPETVIVRGELLRTSQSRLPVPLPRPQTDWTTCAHVGLTLFLVGVRLDLQRPGLAERIQRDCAR